MISYRKTGEDVENSKIEDEQKKHRLTQLAT
jgi:hypothetical protein